MKYETAHVEEDRQIPNVILALLCSSANEKPRQYERISGHTTVPCDGNISIMSEKFEADPAHVKRGAGRVYREWHKITVVGVYSNSIQKGVPHGRHQLGEDDGVQRCHEEYATRHQQDTSPEVRSPSS